MWKRVSSVAILCMVSDHINAHACMKKQLSHKQMLCYISAFLQFGPRGGDITSLDIRSFSNLNVELPTHIIYYGEPESNVQVNML